MMSSKQQAIDSGLEALGREASQRELERRERADAEAVKTMTSEQIEAARWSKLSPSEWLYWAERR